MMNVELLKNNPKLTIVGFIAIILITLLQFTPSATKKSVLPPAAMNRHIEQNVQFFTKIIGNQNRTRVYFPFSFQGESFPLFLGYQTKEGGIKEFLVYHPQTSKLAWSTIREDGLTLFQKSPNFTSIKGFVNQASGEIYIDSLVKSQYPDLNAKDLPISNDRQINLDEVDYILTSQAPIKEGNATYYYENIIDTTDAKLDETEQITWLVRAPDADENNVFYLGNIDIEYLQ